MNDQLRNKDIPVDSIIDSLRTKLIDISKKCFLVKTVFPKNDNQTRSDNSWFDSECRDKKQKLNYNLKMYQESLRIINSGWSNISSCDLRNAYFQQGREYKALLRSKRKLFLNSQKEKLWSLKSESPKKFWKKLNKGKNKVLLTFTNNQLFDYFDHLLNNDLDGSGNNQEVLRQHKCPLDASILSQIDTELNCPITMEEVQNMVANLKTGKAPGLDMISAELLKNLHYKLYIVFVRLFNRVFQSGDFPEEWAIGIIVLLFKGGIKSDLDNYRGITLLSIFGKLFIGILLQRLQKTVAKYEILRENQIAYRKGYQTSDHIFTLRAIIEHTFEVKKGPLYLCFIDFSKAFDSINHAHLIKKLCMYGIQGNLLNIISSLYSKVKSCVKGSNELTDLFSCSRGVRQGCLLSPLLFALFLNDLDNKISDSSAGVNIGEKTIHTLLYADDLVLLANSPKDMQLQLNLLNTLLNSSKMKVNLGKTKIMVLRKNKRKSRAKKGNEIIWKLGDKEIEECEVYKYLGVIFKSNGSFSEHAEKIKEKAQKSYFSLLAKSREWGGFQPRLFLYLFDHTILPVLNYASEIWGTNEWPKLERLHLSACKYALGVKSSTTTDAVYAELGRYSVLSSRHINILKFFMRLSNLENERYANIAFNMLVADADAGYSNWVSTARNLVSIYDIKNSDNNTVIKQKVQRHFQSSIINNLALHISQDKKLKTFALFKSTFKFEAYLDIFWDFGIRSNFTKLRLSAHNLQIETGRYGIKKTPRTERYCIHCKSKESYVVEDEVHFLVTCPLFAKDREAMLTSICAKFPSIRMLSEKNLFIWLLSQEDVYCLERVGKFCTNAFLLRENTLKLAIYN